MTADIQIVPIFNQAAPGIWYDFAHICAATMYTNYNSRRNESEINDWICKYATDWKKRRAKFAFGAYYGDKMVGFIQGWARARQAWVDSLYLLRPYQGAGVGKRLLHVAEGALSNMASYVELISLGGALSFYESRGYRSHSALNHYVKDLKTPVRCNFIPVFWVSAALARQCRGINPDFDSAMVNAQHMPMFAHFDIDGRLDGYIGAGSVNQATPHLRDTAPDFVRTVLQNAFDRCRGLG